MDDRAARAWTERMAITPRGDGRYAVDSESGATYVVDLPAGDCNCLDHRIRDERCKHLRRVALEVNARRVPPPGKRRDDCAACGHEAFVPEDGPPLCASCALDRGDVVRDRETGDLMVVADVTDRRADEVTIEDGTTVADYGTNEDYPDDDLVVAVVYPFSSPGADLADLQRYSFPYSRLDERDERIVDL